MMCECWSCRVFVLFTYSPKIWTGIHSISSVSSEHQRRSSDAMFVSPSEVLK